MALTVQFLPVGLASALAFINLGGGLYEFSVVDPFWPRRLEIVQPARGDINRKRFWIPAHVAFELTLIAALVVTWSQPEVRFWLLTALASHAVMRLVGPRFHSEGPRSRAGRSRDDVRSRGPANGRGEACCAFRSM